MHVIKDDSMKVPLKAWSKEGSIDINCIEQMKNVCSLPFLYKHVSLMPDAHFGYGASIGAVVATKEVVIPSLVGVDIGCGMCAVKTSLKLNEVNRYLKSIMSEIRERVPVGFTHNEKTKVGKYPDYVMPDFECDLYLADDYPVVNKQLESAKKQIGTLGGGNHFIEIQKDEEDFIWIMIHSGSRNLGKQVADYYIALAKELNSFWYSSVTKDLDLAFLPLMSKQGKSYLREINYCLEFAYNNRYIMMEEIKHSIVDTLVNNGEDMGIIFESIINIHHNYASLEHHYGKDVIVHRKGATLAREGTIGIIPGSQGTASYIVEGLGNPESFNSCSHGAGRCMGRKQAQRELDLEAEQKILEDQGIIHSIRNTKDLDEATSCYKNIDIVMEEQKDLVKILHKLKPLAVIKG